MDYHCNCRNLRSKISLLRRPYREEVAVVKRLAMTHLLAAIFACFIVGPLVWMALDRTAPYEVINGTVVPTVVTPRSKVSLNWHIHVVRPGCTGFYQRYVVDSTNRVWPYKEMPSYYLNLPIGEHDAMGPEPYVLPSGLSQGSAYTYSTMRFYCNFLQRWFDWPIRRVTSPLHFTVE